MDEVKEIRVPLSGSAIYVTGTVNGVDKVWTRQEGNWWSTTADRSADGIYVVALTIVYADGKAVNDSITLYYGLVLITDRTNDDVLNGTKKGFYNSSDLNRVGAAMQYVRDRLVAEGYTVEGVSPRTDWKQSDYFLPSNMEMYLGYLGVLREVLALPEGTPEVPSTMRKFSYSAANDIEKILEVIDQMITNSVSFLFYSDDLYSGEV